MIFDILKLIINDLYKRKFSTFLTLFAISLGILSVFVIVLLSTGLEESIKGEFESFGTNRIFISSSTGGFQSESSFVGDTEINLLKNQPYITEVYPYYAQRAQLKYSNDFLSKTLQSFEMDKKAFEDLGLEIEFGRYPRLGEDGVVIIGPEFAKNGFDKEISLGSNIEISGKKFKVIGITKSLGNPEDDNQVYADLEAIRKLFNKPDSVSFLYIIIDEGEDISIAEENIERILENRLGEDTFEITTPEQFLEQVSSILDIVKYTFGGIAFVAIIVGGLGIINTMYVIVTEKTKDIGIMKSVGATNEIILFMYMTQAGMFGLLGALLGTFFGYFLALGIEAIAQSSGYAFLEITVSLGSIIGLLFFGFVIGIFAGFLPSYKASKLTIIDTLRK